MPIAELFLNLHNHRSTANFSETDISELEAIAQLFPLNFDETGDQIKQILEKRYTDGISGFKNVKVEGSKIVGIFYDIVSPALTKSFNFTIDSDTGDVDYTQINTGNLESEHSEYEFAAPAKKSKQCNEGKSSACTRADGSVYCIKIGYKCKSVGLSTEEKQVAKTIVEKGGALVLSRGSITKTNQSTTEEKQGREPRQRDEFGYRIRTKGTKRAAEKTLKTVSNQLHRSVKKLGKTKPGAEKDKLAKRVGDLLNRQQKILEILDGVKAATPKTIKLDRGDLKTLEITTKGTPTAREITSAYRTASQKYHPDANVAKSPQEREKLATKFLQVTEAYKNLKKQYGYH